MVPPRLAWRPGEAGRPRKVKLAGEFGNYAPEKKRVQGKSKIIENFS
jgi:hypothetical protein